MAQVKTICMEALERHCSSGETGRLDLHRSPLEGQIFTQNSWIVHAQLAGLEGAPALFRLFDWGDADVTWNPGVEADQTSLHLSMEEAGVLYAEHLQERNTMEAREQERLNLVLATSSLVAASESVLKSYSIRLEAKDDSLLPGGFVLSDSSKSSYVIGSSEECDVVLRHPSVDPIHCGLILEAGSVYVWDLGSQAGLKLNNFPTAEGKLKVGDVMTLGSVDLKVKFNLKRPSFQRPATMPMPAVDAVAEAREGPPPKGIPKGAITYEKVARQLKNSGKGSNFLTKLGSLFGSKDQGEKKK